MCQSRTGSLHAWWATLHFFWIQKYVPQHERQVLTYYGTYWGPRHGAGLSLLPYRWAGPLKLWPQVAGAKCTRRLPALTTRPIELASTPCAEQPAAKGHLLTAKGHFAVIP